MRMAGTTATAAGAFGVYSRYDSSRRIRRVKQALQQQAHSACIAGTAGTTAAGAFGVCSRCRALVGALGVGEKFQVFAMYHPPAFAFTFNLARTEPCPQFFVFVIPLNAASSGFF